MKVDEWELLLMAVLCLADVKGCLRSGIASYFSLGSPNVAYALTLRNSINAYLSVQHLIRLICFVYSRLHWAYASIEASFRSSVQRSYETRRKQCANVHVPGAVQVWTHLGCSMTKYSDGLAQSAAKQTWRTEEKELIMCSDQRRETSWFW